MVQPKLSTVKYKHRNDQRELEIHSLSTHFSSAKRKLRKRKKKVSYLQGETVDR